MVTKASKDTVKTKRRKTKEADKTSEELNTLESLAVSGGDEDQDEIGSVQTPEDESVQST